MQQESPGGSSSKRKKWTEEEELTLINKYAEMKADGSLSLLKTRESRFRPISAHVNAVHHAVDPVNFPFLWTWKDASSKAQNMRHQYRHVIAKLRADGPEFALRDGPALWPNFLHYKAVFEDDHGFDIPKTSPNGPEKTAHLGVFEDEHAYDVSTTSPNGPKTKAHLNFIDEEHACGVPETSPKRPRKKAHLRIWARVKAHLEERDAEAAAERRRVEERRRGLEEAAAERRREWRERMEELMGRHRLEMAQIQARVAHVQQGMVGQVLGVMGQWAGPGTQDFDGGGGFSGHHHHHHNHHHHQDNAHGHHPGYVNQMMHHMNGIGDGDDGRVDGESQDDQFIVDD